MKDRKRYKGKKYRRIQKECWNLDANFSHWLNTRLKVYLKDADTIIALDQLTFMYEGEEQTFKQLIKRMITLTSILCDVFDNGCDSLKKYNLSDPKEVSDELFDILKLTFFYLWW